MLNKCKLVSAFWSHPSFPPPTVPPRYTFRSGGPQNDILKYSWRLQSLIEVKIRRLRRRARWESDDGLKPITRYVAHFVYYLVSLARLRVAGHQSPTSAALISLLTQVELGAISDVKFVEERQLELRSELRAKRLSSRRNLARSDAWASCR